MTPPTSSPRDRRSAPPAAVLFDLDGTLVDSERLWLDTIRDRLEIATGAAPCDLVARFEGLSSAAAARLLIQVGGASAPEAEVADALEDATIDAFAAGLDRIAGSAKAIDGLRRAGVPVALVTSSTARWVEAVDEHVALGAFDAIVTADDVRRTKPHPEPYLRATELLGVDPAACVAFEDSAVGVRAALAAGCRVVQVGPFAGEGSTAASARVPDLRRVTAAWVASLPALRAALPEPAVGEPALP